MHARTLSPALAALALLACHAAWAGRPLVTETADVPDKGTCEVETALARVTLSGEPTLRAWDSTFSCGWGLQSQAGLGYARERQGDERAEGLRFAGKTTLRAPQEGVIGWGIAYGLGGARAAGKSYRLEDIGATLAATHPVAEGWLVHANLGVAHSRALRQNTTLWSLGVETTSELSVAADVFGDDRGRPSVSAGLGYSFGGGLSASLAWSQLYERPRLRTLTGAVKLVF